MFLIFVGRIAALYPLTSDTYDEPSHVLLALKWVETGDFLDDGYQAPLPRLTIAMTSRLAGYSSENLGWANRDWSRQEMAAYWRSLTVSRLGTAPFAILLFWTVTLWSRSLFGDLGALAAAFAVSSCPSILGHAALATLDVPGAAGMLLALWAIWRWVERDTLMRAVLAGGAAGFAQMSKFSALGFLLVPVSFAVVSQIRNRRMSLRWLGLSLSLGAVAAFLVIWACYGFETGPVHSFRHITAAGGPDELAIGRIFEGRTLFAPIFWKGVVDMAYLQHIGHPATFLGESSRHGWWQYFPVAFVLKVSPPLLCLAAIAVFVGSRLSIIHYLLVSIIGIFLVSLPSHVDIGVRHVMPVFPLLCILAGSLFTGRRSTKRYVLASTLLVWLFAESVMAHPNYIAYFAPPFRAKDYFYLSDSNLNWGQDRWRVLDWVQAHADREAHVLGGGFDMLLASGWENGPGDSDWLIVDTNMASIIMATEESDLAQLFRFQRPEERIGRSYLVFYRGGRQGPAQAAAVKMPAPVQ